MIYLLLILGFVFLIKGADFFVEGASNIAELLRVPSVIIGLTIVAMGTSAPEAAVSITAGFSQSNDIALGNVIGSNIFNILVVVGICAVIKKFDINKSIIKRDFIMSIISTSFLLLFISDRTITFLEGFIFIIFMIGYIVTMVFSAIKSRKYTNCNTKSISLFKSVLFTICGIIAVIIGGQLVVDNAVKIAQSFKISQSLIGLTIVAVGTSLPELVTSISAAKKGKSGLALGNVIGSNIFNILFILGASSALNPITVSFESIIDTVILLIITVIAFIWSKATGKLNRVCGIIWLLSYVAYTIYICIR